VPLGEQIIFQRLVDRNAFDLHFVGLLVAVNKRFLQVRHGQSVFGLVIAIVDGHVT